MAVWRVYLPEWLVAYTSKAKGDDGHAECSQWRREHLPHTGATQVRIVATSEIHPGQWEYCLQVRSPNLRRECRDRDEALKFADDLGPAAHVVERFSPEEAALLRTHREISG